MRLTYNDLWTETQDLVRAYRTVLVALAGAFFFLPSLLSGHLMPLEPLAGETLFEAAMRHARDNWPGLLAASLVEMLGTLAMLRLFLKPEGRTVGGDIVASLALLPGYFAARFIATLMIVIGLMALVVPGVYLFGRLAVLGAAIVAEGRRNPFDALRRAFALTRGHGFAVAGIFVILYVASWVISLIVTSALGAVAILALGREPGMLVALAGGAVVGAAAAVLLVALAAIVYRRLSAATPGAQASGI
ncbi:MAG TPA: hypothetical protein VGB08_09940 [Allosphingosinicella sp.]|jgi:hypothetical protein